MSRWDKSQESDFFVFFFGSEYTSNDSKTLYLYSVFLMKTENTRIPLISIKNLSRSYPDSKRKLFDKFNLELNKGDFLVVTGKSWSGKSTLVKFLIGQLKAPKKTLFYKLEDMADFSDAEIQRYRRKIGSMFQDYELIHTMTPQENIIYPLLLEEVPLTTIKTKYDAVKEIIDLSSIQTSDIKRLSGGEKQKVSIARALIHAPDFIIADEPTGNLDSESTMQIAEILIRANKLGNTIVLVTHDTALLEFLRKNANIKMLELIN